MTDDKPTYEELLNENINLKKQLSDNINFGFCNRHQQFEKMLIAQSAIMDSTNDLIWSVNSENFGLVTFNQSLYNYFFNARGIQIKIGDRPEYLLPTDEYAQIWHNLYRKALNEGSYSCEYTVFNNTRTLELNFNLLKHNSIIFGISVFGREITLIKQNELELISAKNKAETEQQQQKALIENAIIPVLITTAQGKVLYFNKACYDFFAFPLDIDLETINPLDYWVFPENRALYIKQIQEKGAALNFENYLITTKKEVKTVLQSASFIKYNDEMRLFSIIYDITEQKNLEKSLITAKETTEESDEKHRTLLDTMFEGVTLNELIFNEQGEVIDYRILEANEAFNNHSDIKRNEVVGKLATDVYNMSSEYIKEFWNKNLKNKNLITSDYHVEQTGSWTRVKTSPVKNNKFTITLFDITEQKKSEELVKQKSVEIELHNSRLESLLKITQLQTNSMQELLDFALNEAIILTSSKIGYIYYYNEEKRQFILNTWSKNVMPECKVMNPQTIYDLDKTGCWGEAVRQRKPIVINNYQDENQLKKGTPHGHVALKKFLTIPVIFEDKIVAVCGVANKETDYDNSDIRQLSLLMDSVWKISERLLLIKDLKAAKEKAEENEKQLKRAQQTAKTGNWIWYIHENKLWWSDEMYNIFEIDKDTFTGELDKVVGLAIHPDDKEAVDNSNISVMVHKKPIPVEYRLNTKDGSIKYVLGLADNLICDENGKSEILTGIVKDITDYKLIQIELQKAKEKAEESDRLKTAFLQNMSHEIRTPLNAISGFSGMLNKPELSEEKRKSFISIIQNSSKQLISIVSDILTISALETKQEKLNIDKVCINNIIVDLLSVFKQQSINHNISLYAKKELNDIQSEIYTDRTKITQILSNLLTNALKFTHEGFIEFGYNIVETHGVETHGRASLHELQFYVKDSGIGIQPEFHEKIFERFRQADKSIQLNYGGTGLGLSISKGFVDLLGGKIWVESEPQKGATFYFTIPYKPVNETDKTVSTAKQNSNLRTILVAEDEEYNFLLIEEILSDLDLKLIHAKDGKAAVEICKANPNIDLILMDIKMPIMTGDTAAKLIKEFRPELPIIAQTGYALEVELKKYSGIFDDYTTKPIKEKELKQKLMKYIDVQK